MARFLALVLATLLALCLSATAITETGDPVAKPGPPSGINIVDSKDALAFLSKNCTFSPDERLEFDNGWVRTFANTTSPEEKKALFSRMEDLVVQRCGVTKEQTSRWREALPTTELPPP